jgi:hypothetical protein
MNERETENNTAEKSNANARRVKPSSLFGFAKILGDLLPRQLQLLLHEAVDIVNDAGYKGRCALLIRILDFGSHGSGPHYSTNYESDTDQKSGQGVWIPGKSSAAFGKHGEPSNLVATRVPIREADPVLRVFLHVRLTINVDTSVEQFSCVLPLSICPIAKYNAHD